MNVVRQKGASSNCESVFLCYPKPILAQPLSYLQSEYSDTALCREYKMMIEFSHCMPGGQSDITFHAKAIYRWPLSLRISMMFALSINVLPDGPNPCSANALRQITATPDRWLKSARRADGSCGDTLQCPNDVGNNIR